MRARSAVSTPLAPPLEDQGLAAEGAPGDEQPAPELPRLPPAVVAGVVAEPEEDRERDADERERRAGDDRHQSREIPVGEHDQRRQRDDEEELRKDARQDRAAGGAHDEEDGENAGLLADDHDGLFFRPPAARPRACRSGATAERTAVT